MKKGLLIFILGAFPFFSYSQVLLDARSYALANSTIASPGIGSIQQNYAQLSQLDSNVQIQSNYKNSYGISDINQASLILGIPLKNYPIGISYNRFGNSQYNTNLISLGSSVRLSKSFALGLALSYQNIHIDNYKQKWRVNNSISLLSDLSPKVKLGVQIENPFRKTKNKEALDLDSETAFKIGLSYHDKKYSLSSQINKYLSEPASIHLGLSIFPNEYFIARLGVQSQQINAGFGLKINKNLQIDIATSAHKTLGISSIISLSYDFK